MGILVMFSTFVGVLLGCLIYGGLFRELNATGQDEIGTTRQRRWDFALFANTVGGNSIFRTIVADCGDWVHFRGVNTDE